MKSVSLVAAILLELLLSVHAQSQDLNTLNTIDASVLTPGIFADIYSNEKYAHDYPEYIHVILNEDGTATFQLCEQDGGSCRLLGNRERYSLRDLRYRYKKLRSEARRMVTSDVSYVALSALGGTIVALAAPTPVGAGAIAIYAASGAAAGGLSVMRTYMTPNASNAVQKYKEMEAIDDDVLSDRPVYVNEPVTETAKRLDAVLRGMI